MTAARQLSAGVLCASPAVQISASRCSGATSPVSACRRPRSVQRHTNLSDNGALVLKPAFESAFPSHTTRRRGVRSSAAGDAGGSTSEEDAAALDSNENVTSQAATERSTDAGAPADEELLEKIASFGAELAKSEEAAYLVAQAELQQANKERQQRLDLEQQQQQQEQQLLQTDAEGRPSSDTVAAAGAAPYAAASSQAPNVAAGTSAADRQQKPSAAAPYGGTAGGGKPATAGGIDLAAAVREKLARAAEYRKTQREAKASEEGDSKEGQDGEAAGGVTGRLRPGGSVDVAAGFLASVMQNSTAPASPNKDLRAEKFTELKEAERRRNVEIITVERDYNPAESGGYAEGYKPKVATWGMFPRPNNISKAYGGGRTLKPGEALESEDARAARSRRVSEAMKRYKKSSGLEVDPVVQARAQASLDAGTAAFRNGQLANALVHFTDAADLMPLRSAVGGEARLQQAITQDSLGKAAEAKVLYQSLKGHPTGAIAKKAKQLLGGFEAMTFLKADQFSYAANPREYDKYFRRMQSTYDTIYYSSAGEKEDLTAPTVIATAVMLLPLLLVGVKLLQKSL